MTLRQILWDATWGNNMAQLEWTLLLAALAWPLRHHIGRHLAAWWDRHHGPHAVKRQKQALREHEQERGASG